MCVLEREREKKMKMNLNLQTKTIFLIKLYEQCKCTMKFSKIFPYAAANQQDFLSFFQIINFSFIVYVCYLLLLLLIKLKFSFSLI